MAQRDETSDVSEQAIEREVSVGRRRRARRAHGEGAVYWREDRKRWVVELDYGNVDGRRKRSVRYFRTQDEAVEAQREARQAQADGVDHLDRRSRFSGLLDYWLDDVVEPSDRADSTKSNYRDMVENHIRPSLGKLRLVELKHEDVQRFLNRKAAEGYSTSTMRTFRTILRQVLAEGLRTERVTRNVADGLRIPKAKKPRREVAPLDKDGGIRLLAAVEGTRWHALYVLLAMVGLRRGEVLALRWSDFDSSAKTLRVERQVTRVRGIRHLVVGPTKSAAGKRTIALPARCVAVLRTHRRHQAADRDKAGKRWKENGLIFPSTVGTHMEPRALNTHLTKLCRRAGLPHLGPHALRHTAATMAYALGVDWKQLQGMLGHTMLSTTMDIYVSMIDDVNRDAASKLDGWFPDDEEDPDDD